MRWARWLTVSCFVLQALGAAAAVQTLSGRFDDPANSALRASDLGAAQFADDSEVANNVALHAFSLAGGATVEFTSLGFAAGGADPYFSLFSGSGNGAAFLASNFDNASTVGGDFVISLLLGAGDYTIALGVFENLSFAENLGAGTLGDGFIGLGQAGLLGNASYQLRITTVDTSVPLPATAALVVMALGLLAVRGRRIAA